MGAVKMPWCSPRSRPIGPPAPRLGGRRPRRRLCLPPPWEERPGPAGPAFIFFLWLNCEFQYLNLIYELVARSVSGRNRRPDLFRLSPTGRKLKVWLNTQPHTGLPADRTPHRLDAIRET